MAIPFSNTFDYKQLSRSETNEGRKYVTPYGESLPSVTTILAATKSEESKQVLANWRKRKGEKVAAQITKEAAGAGTSMHSFLEDYILGKERPNKTNLVHVIAKQMADQIIENGLSKLTKVHAVEASLFFKHLYAGTTDLIGEIKDELYIVDFKNSLKPKKDEWIEDYYIQTVAYMLAHDDMFGTKIRKGKIMIAIRPDQGHGPDVPKYQEFNVNEDNYNLYVNKWIEKLDQFYSNK